LENEQSRGGNRRIDGGKRAPAVKEVLHGTEQNEVNASEDEIERVRKEDRGHDRERLSTGGMFFGFK
jgi:hypothetical protein